MTALYFSGISLTFIKKWQLGAIEMAQWVKEFSAMPGHRSSSSRIHERRELKPTSCPLTYIYVPWHVHTPTYTETHHTYSQE